MSKTLEQWLKYIATLHRTRIDLGLKRVTTIARKTGLNQFPCPVITVAGTNGKGSCVRTLESIYIQAGYRVAAYTSPHLQRFNERIRINGYELSDEVIISSFIAVESLRQEHPLSFFEFITLAAFYLFKQAKPDVILLEVGLGGRLDAVNVVDSDIAIITNIALDHCDRLGPDRESIGFEKAGIMRRSKPVICGDVEPPQSVLKQAKKHACLLYLIQRDFQYEVSRSHWSWQSKDACWEDLPVAQLKIENIASSLMAIALLQRRLPVDNVAIKAGLGTLQLPGRYEKITEPIPCVLDVAHNPQSASWLAEQLIRDNYQNVHAVIGMMPDKQIAETIRPLLKIVQQWYVVSIDTPRGCGSEQIVQELTTFNVKKWYNFSSVSAGIAMAMNQNRTSHLTVVFGSFYTVAAAKDALARVGVLSEYQT